MSHIEQLKNFRIPFETINDCTKNFANENFIGKGGYGNVYKGILSWAEHKNQYVAVKRLDETGFQGNKEFYTEITMLSQYRHKNIIALVGFCDEGKEMIVVYEYASHGSLDKYLSDCKKLDQLSWKRRLKICIGIASALDYLHNHVAAEHRVIHRDMKSANILLDENWKPKLSDFGLSRIGLANQQNTFLITNVAGTHWYCDPQYEKTGILTKESDVYSFGVVLFEVLCGRLVCVMDYHDKRRFLHHLVRTYYKNRELEMIVDYRIMDHIKGTKLSEFSSIAYQCLQETREERPPIHEVVLKLKKLKDTQANAKIKGPHENLEDTEQQGSNVPGFTNNNHADNLLSETISELEHEFKQLLSYSKAVEPDRLYECLPSSLRPSSQSPDPGHTDHITAENAVYNLPILIPTRVLPLLHDLAQGMVQAGHRQQCLIIYRDTRSQVLQESLHQLGAETLSKDDVQKIQWEVLELKTGNWIHFMRIAVKLLFAAERKICDQVFEGIDTLKDQCFVDAVKGSVAMLLGFGDAIASSKISPDKLYVLLDMYKIMHELHSEIETLFSDIVCIEIREGALGLTKKIAQTTKEMFGGFEETVEIDAMGIVVVDGTVHPLTSYVINYVTNYVKFLFDYQSTPKQPSHDFEMGDQSNAELVSVVMRIMQALQTKLDEKSKQYKDPALTNLFLMNNIHYMVQSIDRFKATNLVEDDWVQRHRRTVEQHAIQYKRITLAKILQCLTIQGSTSDYSSGVSKAGVQERLKIFNLHFEELHQRQTQWTIPDTELRELLRLSVAEILLPAYRSFIKRFGPLVENGKYPHKYIRYKTEDLDRMLGEFFNGKDLK